MKNRKKLVETIIAGLLGYGYFYYIFIHTNIEALNPHLVFFMLMVVLFIVSSMIKKGYFAFVLALTATMFYIVKFTPLMNKIEYIRLSMMNF